MRARQLLIAAASAALTAAALTAALHRPRARWTEDAPAVPSPAAPAPERTRVEGVVIGPSGPVRDVLVDADGARALTDAEGWFAVEVELPVRITAWGFAGRGVKVGPGDGSEPVVIVVGADARRTVEVVDADGAPVADASLDPDTPGGWVAVGPDGRWSGVVGAATAFRAYAPGFVADDVVDGRVVLRRGVPWRGVVRSADTDAPIAGAEVGVLDGGWLHSASFATTDRDGRFEVTVDPAAWMTSLIVDGPDHAPSMRAVWLAVPAGGLLWPGLHPAAAPPDVTVRLRPEREVAIRCLGVSEAQCGVIAREVDLRPLRADGTAGWSSRGRCLPWRPCLVTWGDHAVRIGPDAADAVLDLRRAVREVGRGEPGASVEVCVGSFGRSGCYRGVCGDDGRCEVALPHAGIWRVEGAGGVGDVVVASDPGR